MGALVVYNQPYRSQPWDVLTPSNGVALLQGVVNAICEIGQYSKGVTRLMNIPCLICKVVFDTATAKSNMERIARLICTLAVVCILWSSLIVPFGRIVVIGIDFASLFIGSLIKPDQPTRITRALDMTIRQNALRALNVSDEDANNRELLDQAHGRIVNDLRRRQQRLGHSSLAQELEYLVQDMETAHQTLLNA